MVGRSRDRQPRARDCFRGSVNFCSDRSPPPSPSPMLSRTLKLAPHRTQWSRLASTSSSLLLIEHSGGNIEGGTLSALTAASALGGSVTGLVIGGPEEVKAISEKARKCVDDDVLGVFFDDESGGIGSRDFPKSSVADQTITRPLSSNDSPPSSAP